MLSVGVNLWRPSLLGGGVSLPRWQAALAAQQAGTRNANVLFVGDSTTFGLGGGTGGSNETNCKNNCFVSMLLRLIANSSNSSWFGDASGGQASFATYDARIGSEGSWQLSEDREGFNFSVPVLGGPALVVPSGGGTSPLTFTPTNAVNTFVIYYLRYPGSGGLNIYIDGTLQTNVSEDIASGTGQASVTVTAASAGTHTVGVASDGTAANVFLCGIKAYNSAVKEISLMNAGWSGSTANNWVNPVNSSGAAYAPLPTITAWAAPDLTFIDLTINDWRGDGSGNYSDEIQAIITQAQTTGDVVLMTGVPSNGIDQAFMQGFVDTILSLATANNCPVIDFFSLWGKAWVSSWMYDDFHPNATGYAQQAPVIANMIGAGDAAQTTAFLARTSGLSGTETAAYKALINGLVSNGLFGSLDALYIFATKDTTTANLNLISTSYALTQNGTVSFSADHGYTGDGSTGYFDTGLQIGVGNFQDNSQTLGIYVLTNRMDTATAILEIGWSDEYSASYSYISPRQNALGFVSAMESVNCTSSGTTNSQGAWTVTRTGSTAEAAYLDAGSTPFATASGASTSPSSPSLTVLIGAGTFGGTFGYSPDEISAAWIGGGLTGAQVATLHSLINAYMTALGINVYAGAPSGDAAQTKAFLARTSGLSGTETAAYKALINGLVSNDLFSLLDALYIFATKDTTTANLNLISTSYGLTQYGTVTFSADHGYTGDGSTGYFDTKLPIGVGNFQHNSQTLGVYVRTNRTDTATAILEIGWSDQFGSSYSYISPRQNALGFVSAMESVNCTASGTTNSQGAWTTSRTASNAEAAYLDAGPAPFATASGASVAPSGSSLTVLIGAGTFGGLTAPSPDQISAAWIGAGLTGAQVATLHSLINAYMTALGINVY